MPTRRSSIVLRALSGCALGRLERLLAYDFCPWANRYVYWLKQPIGWFVLAAAMSLLVGCFLGPQGFVLCAALLGIVLLGVAWPWIAIRAVRGTLHFDRRRCREGDLLTVRLQVANRFPWPVWGLAIERGFLAAPSGGEPLDPLAVDAVAVALARVPGWSVNDYLWEFQPECRGVYPTEPPKMSCGFPFGIWVARGPLTVAGELIVWPRTVRLSAIPPLTGHGSRPWRRWSVGRSATRGMYWECGRFGRGIRYATCIGPRQHDTIS